MCAFFASLPSVCCYNLTSCPIALPCTPLHQGVRLKGDDKPNVPVKEYPKTKTADLYPEPLDKDTILSAGHGQGEDAAERETREFYQKKIESMKAKKPAVSSSASQSGSTAFSAMHVMPPPAPN